MVFIDDGSGTLHFFHYFSGRANRSARAEQQAIASKHRKKGILFLCCFFEKERDLPGYGKSPDMQWRPFQKQA